MNFIKKIAIYTMVCIICVGCKNYKYNPGRDTVVIVGDGRYQILECMGSYSLSDLSINDADDFLLYVLEYYDDENGHLYVTDRETYIIIDYNKNSYHQYKGLDDNKMDESDKKIFESNKMINIKKKDSKSSG